MLGFARFLAAAPVAPMTPVADSVIDSSVAWWRLVATLTMSTLGGVGMWSVIVALPAVQAEFGVDRGTASLPYTLTMVGFGLGGILMGKLTDRFGVSLPLAFATLALALGYGAAALAPSLLTYALAQGLLIGFLGFGVTAFFLTQGLNYLYYFLIAATVCLVNINNEAAAREALRHDTSPAAEEK